MEKIEEEKKRGKTIGKYKSKGDKIIPDFHYFAPLLRLKDLGQINKKRQGYIKTENKRQVFLKDLFKVTNQVPNYYSPKFHKRSWWPNGKYLIKRRYNYTQTGLEHYYEKNNVEQLNPIKNSDLFEMKKEKVLRKEDKLKNFKEYENISPGNYVITIEYCSSCEEHYNITQHGEDRIFRELAIKFQKIITERFSFIKVYLKPIDVDIVKNIEFKIRLPDKNGEAYPPFPSINDQFKECKIGAFEIQISTKDSKGNMIKKMLHSKLKTKKFPVVENVLGKIAAMMPLFNLNLILFDQEDYQELDKMNNIEVNIYLSNSHIIKKLSESVREQVNNFVKPGRRLEMIQRLKILQEQTFTKTENNTIDPDYQRNFMTLNNTRSIKSSLLRKKTHSKSKTKTKTNLGLNADIFSSTNSGLSSDYKGQNIQEYKYLKSQRGSLIQKLYSKVDENISQEDFINSSESVSLKFNKLPYDTYIIETKENSNFQGSITLLKFNEININNNGQITKYIGLWHQQKAILHILLYKEIDIKDPENNQIKKDQIPINTSIITISDADDPNSRYQVSRSGGMYRYKTQPGEYKLEIDTKDFERDVRKIKLNPGLNTLNIKLNPDKNCELLIEVLEYNEIFDEEKNNEDIDLLPVRNAKIQIFRNSNNLLMEGITNKKGLMKYFVDKNDNNLSIKITKEGYFKSERIFRKYSSMKVNENGNYKSSMRIILVNQKKLDYYQKAIFISYFNVCKQIFDFQYQSVGDKNIVKIKDWQKEKGIFIATFNKKEELNQSENNNNGEETIYEEIIRIGLKISPNAIKDDEGNDKYNMDEFKVTDRDLIEYLRNGCCEGNVYTPKADFHINLPKVFNKMNDSFIKEEKSQKSINNDISKDDENDNNNSLSVKNTKREINDMYWDLGWVDSNNFIYYETSVFFDIQQKPKRLTYYENCIDFLQALIDKQIYTSLFDYFCFNLSILTRGDRYLPKKIFEKKMVELNDFNLKDQDEKKKEELINCIQFICNILCGYDEDNNIRDDSISFNLLKKKVSSGIKNFID